MRAVLVSALALMLAGGARAQGVGFGERRGAAAGGPRQADRAAVLEAYGELPLSFVPNAGQAGARIRYVAQSAGLTIAFAPQEVLLSFAAEARGTMLALRFLGASSHASVEARRALPGTVSYLVGSDRTRWRTGLPTYGEIVYRELWPGIDLAFRGERGQLKYEFRVARGADPTAIRLAYRGASSLSLDASGSLRIHTRLGMLTDAWPRSYRVDGAQRLPVESRYLLAQGGEKGEYGFALGRGYDPRYPLVIDPGLKYSTFIGGASLDRGTAIAIDSEGNAYVTGETNSSAYPTTPGAFDQMLSGFYDAFVTKLNADGSALVYSTYLGGSGNPGRDIGSGIVVDRAGNAYVTGQTDSSTFPTTSGAFDETHNGSNDAFVTKLDASGTGLVYSTFLGGGSFDSGGGISVDGADNAYVVGVTDGNGFPTTAGAFDTTPNGSGDAFVTKLNPSGSTLLYSTYLGGTDWEPGAAGIAVDRAGNAYVAGETFSSDYPVTPGAFDETANGGKDAFVSKLNESGSALRYSTYLGGASTDGSVGIALDGTRNAYATGHAYSVDFPTTPGAFDATLGGPSDAFVSKLNASGSALAYSTFLGGGSFDSGTGVRVDGAGNAYVVGQTDSADYPTTAGAFDQTYNGGFGDTVLTRLNAVGSALEYSTFLGGGSTDAGYGIAVRRGGKAYVTGETVSADYPTTPGAFDESYNGGGDVFVTVVDTRSRPTK
jgi:hypothetical protein